MAFLASSFVTYVIGNYTNLRGNGPNYNFSILLVFSKLLDIY